MSQTEVQLIKNNAVVEADIANDAVTRDKINVVSTASAPGIEIKGDDGSQEGYLQLNCRVNSHGVKIQSPPHSASQSYKIILPDNQIAADKFLKVKSITGSGSTATGQLEFANASGITQADIIRFNTTASLTYDTVTVVDSNWERPDESDDVFDKIGTGMSESSGIFTFPATGIYLVQWIVRFAGSSGSNANHCYIDATVNNSSYVTVAQSAGHMVSNGQMTVIAQSFLDISDTTNRKVRFKVYAAANNQQVLGNTSKNETYATFIRLGDT